MVSGWARRRGCRSPRRCRPRARARRGGRAARPGVCVARRPAAEARPCAPAPCTARGYERGTQRGTLVPGAEARLLDGGADPYQRSRHPESSAASRNRAPDKLAPPRCARARLPTGPSTSRSSAPAWSAAAIARELTLRGASLRPDRGGRRRRRRHQQGQHRDPAHRLRRQARHPGVPPGPRRGYALLTSYAARVGIPAEAIGALLVAWNDEQPAALPGIAGEGRRQRLRAVPAGPGRGALRAASRALGPGALGALEVPDEGILCPFTTTLAFATEAVLAGCRRWPSAPRCGGQRRAHRTTLGHRAADRVRDRAPGQRGRSAQRRDRPRCSATADFTVTPRRGELIVFDKLARGLVRHILLPVPTAKTKGVLVSPDRLRQRPARADRRGPGRQDATARPPPTGSRSLLAQGARILPGARRDEVTAIYVGLRAATGGPRLPDPGPPRASATSASGGIRSTGVTGLDGDRRARARSCSPRRVSSWRASRREPELRMPNIGEPPRAPTSAATDRSRTRSTAGRLLLRARHRAARSPRDGRARSRRPTSTACGGAPGR